MNKLDIVMLHVNEFGELQNQFRDIWEKEPLKLNAFIDSGEFAFNELRVILFADASVDFVVDYRYSPYTKKLTITDEQHGYIGKIDDTHIITDLYSNHKGELQQNIEIHYESQEHKKALVEGAKRSEIIGTPQNWVSDLGILFWSFNMLVVSLPHKLKEKTKQTTRTITEKKNGKVRYKNVVYLEHCYTLPKDFKLTKTDIKHIIKCPAWGVRGHYRHLSNGQKVYVRPYIKGKYRNDGTKYVAKTYKT